MKIKLIQRVYANIARHTAERQGLDLQLAMQLKARDESAHYAAAMMTKATAYTSRNEILLDAIARIRDLDGCICEFGVFQGESLKFIAKSSPARNVHGFDSFDGLPEKWRVGFDKGTFKTNIPTFREKNIHIHPGWFDESIDPFLRKLDEPIAMLHIDCDLYSSASYVLRAVSSKMAKSSIIVFDEYFNYPGWQDHEHKALIDVIEEGNLSAAYAAYNYLGEQAMITICEKGCGAINSAHARNILS